MLKNLAEQLLTSDECWTFKQALQHFRRTRSVPTLCAQVRPLISTTERLMLLVELSHHLPTEPLRRDFHRLCTLQFPKYHTFLRYFTPHSPAGGGSKVVAQDPKGHLQVVRTRYEDGLIVTETDVTGPAGRSTRTEARSVEPHEVQRHENGFLTTGHKSNYSSRARSVSPYAVSSAGSASSTLHKSHLSSDAKVRTSFTSSIISSISIIHPQSSTIINHHHQNPNLTISSRARNKNYFALPSGQAPASLEQGS